MNNKEKLSYVRGKIESGEYILLSDSMAIGPVYKIPCYGELDKDGFEIAFLYVPSGSGIRQHFHEKDAERYKLISGELKIDGKLVDENICHSQTLPHNIDVCSCDTIIETCKVGEPYLNHMRLSITSEFFDFFSEIVIENRPIHVKKKNR